MWGTSSWGQMLWGGVAVPSLPSGMLVVLMLACFLAGGYFLHPARRNQRNTIVALLLIGIPLSVGAVTLPYTFANGTVADATQVNANFAAVTSALDVASCPAGMTRVDLPRSILCFDKGIQANHGQTRDYCAAFHGARLCSMAQWWDAVCQAGVANPGRSWTNDIAGSATFGTIAACTDESVATSIYTATFWGPCCLEYPRY